MERLCSGEVNLTWYQSKPDTGREMDFGVPAAFHLDANDWVNVLIPYDHFIKLKDYQKDLDSDAVGLELI